MKQLENKAPVVGALAVVAVAALLRMKKKRSRNKADVVSVRPARNPKGVPAQRQADNSGKQKVQEHDTAAEAHSTDVLMTAESFKHDGRIVLCLEIEAGAEEIPPAAAGHASTAFLRLLDLLVAIAVLLICLVVGELATEPCTAAMMLAGMLAVFAAVGLKEACAEDLGSLTPRKPTGHKTATAGRNLHHVMTNVQEAAYSIRARLELEATGAVLAATYWSFMAYQSCNSRLASLASAVQAYSPRQLYHRYLACLTAMAQLGSEECLHGFEGDAADDQQLLQQQAASKQPALEVTAAALVRFTPLPVLASFMTMLQAIARLGTDDDEDQPSFEYLEQLSKQHQQQQRQWSLPAAAWGMALAMAQCLCAPVTAASRFYSCVQAIAALGDEEGSSGSDVAQQQAAVVENSTRSSAASSSAGKCAITAQHAHSIGCVAGLMCCVEAVAQIGTHQP